MTTREIQPAVSDVLPISHSIRSANASQNPNNSPQSVRKSENIDSTERLWSLIREELQYMNEDPKKLQEYGEAVMSHLDESKSDLANFKKLLEEIPVKDEDEDEDEDNEHHKNLRVEIHKELVELKKRVTKLKSKFPSKVKISKLEKETKSKSGKNFKRVSQIDHILATKGKIQINMYNNPIFGESEISKNFRALYHGLDSEVMKLCLLCFAIFPEDAIIRKRIMIYWWMAEGFVSEKLDGVIFLKEFTEKGFLIPVLEKKRSEPHSYKVHLLARVVLISLAEEANFFDFKGGSPTEDYTNSLRACLVGEGLSDSTNLARIHMIFNVNESILEFRPEWFPKMENINILHLGRWQSDEKHHIEIEDSQLLEHFQHLKFLKLLSLQGVSKVTEIPDSIGKLKNLKILDIKACHNLEVIPPGIGSLTNLTHLDISDCYLIVHLPKELSDLENLVVLKGFIILSDSKEKKHSCRLKDLTRLKKLRKLGIYTSSMDFPSEDILALGKFPQLQTLSITWGSDPKDVETKKGRKPANSKGFSEKDEPQMSLPESLKKLELNCYPRLVAPKWLKPQRLKDLEKLYIKGGKLRGVGEIYDWNDGKLSLTKNTWKASIIRLKYLPCMEMNWKEFRHMFPGLVFVEKVNCPKLTLFPCDYSGVWMDKEKVRQT